MFGMSFAEILIIAVIAILFIGPDKLPEAMVKVAKFFKSFKKTVHDTKETIEQEMHLAELKEEAVSYKKQLDDAVTDFKLDNDVNIVDDLQDSAQDIQDSIAQLTSDVEETPQKKTKKKKKNKSEDDSTGEMNV